MKIYSAEKIITNWFYTTGERDGGEGYDEYRVGIAGVVGIVCYENENTGSHFCEVLFNDNSKCRLFNINGIYGISEKPTKVTSVEGSVPINKVSERFI